MYSLIDDEDEKKNPQCKIQTSNESALIFVYSILKVTCLHTFGYVSVKPR